MQFVYLDESGTGNEDVPNFIDSKQVGLIQLADFICFFLRRHIELQMGLVKTVYKDEVEKIGNWTKLILYRSIPKNNIFLKKGQCECSNLFYSYAPETIK